MEKGGWIEDLIYLIPDKMEKMQCLLSDMSEVEKLANEFNPLTLKEEVKYL